MTEKEAFDTKWDVQLRKGTLELVILAALKGRTMYGLELLNQLRQFETIQITEGTLYPLLDRLKRDELVLANWQQEGETRPRKYYSLTDIGLTKLQLMQDRWNKAVFDINHLLDHPGPAPIKP
ncbi:MAG: PadR family transcriptional regulator [Alteromonadaceae bacterium]|nr:PadR family transcriptional regulator [Alteromonadaceae bacterium]